MKTATPSDIGIQKILTKIDDFINHCYFYFIEDGKPDSEELFSDKKLEEMYRGIVSAVENLNNMGYLNDRAFKQVNRFLDTVDDDILYRAGLYFDSDSKNIKTYLLDLLPDVSFEDKFENSPFLKRFEEIRKILSKQLSKEEKTKGIVKGLRGNFSWRRITMYLKGDEVDICEDNRNLGEYKLENLGIPKPKGVSNVKGLFIGLFIDDERTGVLLFSKQNNKNQALKKRLTAILCNAFDTNIDPIEIDENGIYTPVFKAKLGGELRPNDHRSGKKLPKEYE